MKHDTRALTARPYLRTQIDPNYFPDALLEDHRELAMQSDEDGATRMWLALAALLSLAIGGVVLILVMP
jgi:hypothetical protein